MLIESDSDILELVDFLRGIEKPVEVSVKRKAKTTQQLRYAHHLIRAIAIHKRRDFEEVKDDTKAHWGVVHVYTSLVTGDRTARLKSFSEYEKAELMAFISQAEAYCCEHQIPFTPARDSILRADYLNDRPDRTEAA